MASSVGLVPRSDPRTIVSVNGLVTLATKKAARAFPERLASFRGLLLGYTCVSGLSK